MTPDADGWLARGSVASQLSRSILDIHTSHGHVFDLWLEQGVWAHQSTYCVCMDGPALQSLNNSWTSNQDWVDRLGDWSGQVKGLGA